MNYSIARNITLLSFLFTLAGCQGAYYSAWEKLGYEKRDILVSRVKDARDDQESAKKQFQTTLQKFQEVTHFNGGDLEAQYTKLSDAYAISEDRAASVTKRIASVDKVAQAMFSEWQTELEQYSNAELRRNSEEKLRDTKSRYAKLLASMRNAERRMAPVLSAFKDQVLFLKHNLNAKAIASLQTTAAGIDSDVAKLITDMEASIAEANSFIDQMK